LWNWKRWVGWYGAFFGTKGYKKLDLGVLSHFSSGMDVCHSVAVLATTLLLF